MAEKNPIKENNIVNFHHVKHGEKTQKKPEETEMVLYAVPCGEDERAGKEQNRKDGDQPADGMRAMKPFFFIGNRSQILRRRGRKKSLILNERCNVYCSN